MPMPRFAATVSYDGHPYHGWQRQNDAQVSVQSELEAAISQVANHPVNITCCGRTDAGVHALGQVIHFDSEAQGILISGSWGLTLYYQQRSG